jgi:hypothetical protein
MTATLVYGPQTARIETLLTAIRELTPAQIQDFRPPAWDAAWDAERTTAWYATRDAERAAERSAVWVTVLVAPHGALPAVRGAVAALVVLDLVGQYGLEREHIDALCAPMLKIMPELAHLFEPADIAETEPRS